MATFLAAMKLVFEVDSCGAIFSKELSQFDYCGESSMSVELVRFVVEDLLL